MSRNTLLTWAILLLSNVVCISGIIDISWAIHKSPGRKRDCEEVEVFYLDYN